MGGQRGVMRALGRREGSNGDAARLRGTRLASNTSCSTTATGSMAVASRRRVAPPWRPHPRGELLDSLQAAGCLPVRAPLGYNETAQRKGTAMALGAVFSPEEMKRAVARVAEAIADRQAELGRLQGLVVYIAALVSLVNKLPMNSHRKSWSTPSLSELLVPSF